MRPIWQANWARHDVFINCDAVLDCTSTINFSSFFNAEEFFQPSRVWKLLINNVPYLTRFSKANSDV